MGSTTRLRWKQKAELFLVLLTEVSGHLRTSLSAHPVDTVRCLLPNAKSRLNNTGGRWTSPQEKGRAPGLRCCSLVRGKLAIHFFDFFFYEIFAARSPQSVLRGRAVCINADGCAKNRRKKIRCAPTLWLLCIFFQFSPPVRDWEFYCRQVSQDALKPYVCVIGTLRISCASPTCGRHEVALDSGFDLCSGRARPEAAAGKWAFELFLKRPGPECAACYTHIARHLNKKYALKSANAESRKRLIMGKHAKAQKRCACCIEIHIKNFLLIHLLHLSLFFEGWKRENMVLLHHGISSRSCTWRRKGSWK